MVSSYGERARGKSNKKYNEKIYKKRNQAITVT